MESTFINVNSIRLHVIQDGPEDGPLVILLHGFPEFWYGWRQHIEPLAAAGFRVLVPDQRGYNLSAKPKGIAPYQIDYLAQDVLGLVKAAGYEKVFLAGHDWGGIVAWWFALQHPGHLERLAVLNAPHPAVMMHTLQRSLSQLRKSFYVFLFQIPGLPEAILRANDWSIVVEMLFRNSQPGTFSLEDIEHYRQAWWQPDAFTSMLNWYRAFMQMRPALPANSCVRTPTMMLWGVKDTALVRGMAQPSIDLCEQGELVFFENATHWVQHEEALLVNALLIDFFSEGIHHQDK